MTGRLSIAKLIPARGTLSSLVLCAGFSLTGVGTVMLGALLPALSRMWALRDASAGLLLFFQFFGSALGAVFTTSNRIASLMVGYGLLAVSTCALAFSGSHAPFVACFFYGLGLGMVMTATSLLVSDRCGDDRAAKLEGLNFAWSAGAMAGPMLFLPFLHEANIRALFFVLPCLFLLLLAWVAFWESREPRTAPAAAVQQAARQVIVQTTAGSFVSLVILAMCSVGVEAALNGWLTTYAHRAGVRSLAGAALTTSLFWLGGMLSRLAFSTRLVAKVGRYTALDGTIWGILASVAALIAAPYPAAILVLAAVAGICLGPLYPLVLSFLLERTARGWIFAVGGIGAAIFPWLTGLLSSHFNSLRCGLIAPCGAGLLMVLLRSLAVRPARSPELVTSAQS